MTRLAYRRTMELCVSKLESLFEEFQKEFKESRSEFHESRMEFRMTHELILQQLHSLSSKGGSIGESSEATHSDPNLQMGTNPNFAPNSCRQEFATNASNPRQPFLKMDFPRFGDGDEPLGWIYKAEHYFDFFNIEEFKKVKMASFHLEGEPLQWFQWANCTANYPKWEDFTRALCQEFGPSEFNDAAESLVKLRQTGSLRDYVFDFRRLANRTRDMTHSLLKSCLIGGLKFEMCHDVKILKPRDVLEATAYAQQLDAKFSDLKVHRPYEAIRCILVHFGAVLGLE
ncbi:unnamed protein product [Malus baccata var. baccata]